MVYVDKQIEENAYILGTGKYGASNLDLQHEILKQESFDQLKEAGLSKKMTVWDVGCGNGAITEYLAYIVGEEGMVYAIDISEDQIKIAQDKINLKGYKNVKFIVGNINNIDRNKYNKADIVYSRLLLMHVNKPEEVIKIMASLLKPDGKVSLQEASMNSVGEENKNYTWNKYYNLIIAYGKLKGLDYNIGRKLPEICHKLNIFSKIKYYTRSYKTTDDIKKLLSLRLDELKDKFVSSNLITEEEYRKLKMDINDLLRDKKYDSNIIMNEQSYILATVSGLSE